MKKLTLLLAILMLLLTASCAASQEKPNTNTTSTLVSIPTPTLKFTAETFPKMDGSTANIPLAQALAKLFLGVEDAEAEALAAFNTTADSYKNLANGKCDLLLVYEASDETKKELDAMGTQLEYFPIGKDALVFIVNENNPVKSLNQQQLVDIYAGKIKNWNEVGGETLDIAAFQRDPTSGSQALMKKLVMKDVPMAEAPTEFTPAEMGMLIDRLAEYDNSSAAIGYSVYYYASLMYARQGLKFLGVDGVVPTNEMIAAGEYPYTNDFYAVLRKDEPAGSPARQLAEWLGSSEGRALINSCGYVSAAG